MQYIIMADGEGKRWQFFNGLPKHLVEINGERIIERTIRLIRRYENNDEIIVTSHDKRYEFEGAKRYEPQNNNLEIDRFTEELIEDDVCFLYGDTYYTESCIETIVTTQLDNTVFFGNEKSIVGIKVKDGNEFKKHINIIKELYLNGEINKCIGWQVYQSYAGLKIGNNKVIGDFFIDINKGTFDINTPEDYLLNTEFEGEE